MSTPKVRLERSPLGTCSNLFRGKVYLGAVFHAKGAWWWNSSNVALLAGCLAQPGFASAEEAAAALEAVS